MPERGPEGQKLRLSPIIYRAVIHLTLIAILLSPYSIPPNLQNRSTMYPVTRQYLTTYLERAAEIVAFGAYLERAAEIIAFGAYLERAAEIVAFGAYLEQAAETVAFGAYLERAAEIVAFGAYLERTGLLRP